MNKLRRETETLDEKSLVAFKEKVTAGSVLRRQLSRRRLAPGEHREMSMRELIDKGLARRAESDMENAPWYILRPTSRFVTRWDLITASALIWTAFVTPFEVAFLEVSGLAQAPRHCHARPPHNVPNRTRRRDAGGRNDGRLALD